MSRVGSGSREGGFSIVEVLIAVLLLTAVATGVSLAVVGGTSLRGKAKLQAALTASGTAVQEDVAQDREWMDTRACQNIGRACDVSGVVEQRSLELEDLDGVSELILAEATPIDSEADGVGDQDQDGVIPDYYDIVVELQPSRTVAARYAVDAADYLRRFTTSIDRRGMLQEGSLRVEVCEVTNQRDERSTIQGCRDGGASFVDIEGCPPVPRKGCVPAFSWIENLPQHATDPSPTVALRRVTNVRFRLVDANDPGNSWTSGSAELVDGGFVFQNIPAGEYRLDGLPTTRGGLVRWETKELPTFHGPGPGVTGSTVIVEPGLANRALVVYRPKATGQIRMYHDRRTRTHRLGGPYKSLETRVPEWTPTDTYEGHSAQRICDSVNQFAGSRGIQQYTCNGIVMTQPHCAAVLISGTYFHYVGTTGGDYYVDGQGNPNLSPTPGTGTHDEVALSRAKMAEYCTFYAEHLTHTYYGQVGPPTWRTRAGAAKGVTYYAEPKPDNRAIDFQGAGGTIPIASCTVPERDQCPSPIGPFETGLNTSLITTDGDAADAATNGYFRGLPPWADSGAMWIRTNGTIDSPAGSGGRNPRIHMTGMGECYWRSPRFRGEEEGSCDPCEPMWEPGWTVHGCSILVRTDWCRPAAEDSKYFDPVTGAVVTYFDPRQFDIQCGGEALDPPWACSGPVPTLDPMTCRETNPTPPITIPMTRHTSPTTGGDGVVGAVTFTPGSA